MPVGCVLTKENNLKKYTLTMLSRLMRKLKNLKKKITRRHTDAQENNEGDRTKHVPKK
jgi:hypothetical protein